MLKFFLTLFNGIFGVKDLVKDEVRRSEDISVGVDKKTIADDAETLSNVKKSQDARAGDNSSLDSELCIDK